MFIIAVLVLLLVSLALIWYMLGYRPFQFWKSLGIPHPPVKFYFGNAHDIIKLGILESYSKWTNQYGSVLGFYVGAKRSMLISDIDLVKEISVKQFSSFMDRKVFQDWASKAIRGNEFRTGLLGIDGDEWKQTRNIMTPSFSTKKLKKMIPLVETCVDDLLEVIRKLDGSAGTDVWRLFGKFTMQVTLAAAFGRQVKVIKGEADDLTVAATDIFSALADMNFMQHVYIIGSYFSFLTWILNPFVRLSKYSTSLRAIFRISSQLVAARRMNSTEKYTDLLQLLIEAHAEDHDASNDGKKSLTDEEIVGLCIEILLAGYETTSNSLAFTAYLLAVNPDKQDQLISAIDDYFDENEAASLYDASQSIDYLDWVYSESLRYYSPASVVPRHCVKTTVINDVVFPKGTDVLIPVQLIHRMPEYWDEPAEFRPERFSPEGKQSRPAHAFIPFGLGPRHCIGMRFALMEAKMALVAILKEYRFVQTVETEVPLQVITGLTQGPVNGVYLKIEKR